MKIGETRKKKGLSQFALSKKSGISRFRISQYELGYGKLTTKELQTIRKVIRDATNQKSKSE